MRFYRKELFNILADLPFYYIPIGIKFHEMDKENFDNQINKFVLSFAKRRY
jgi:hypothetical protein